jgi:1,6-anhydro-N-acetylmuramate kinase
MCTQRYGTAILQEELQNLDHALDAKDMNHHRAVMIQHALRWAISHGRTELHQHGAKLSAAMFALSPVILSTRQDIDTVRRARRL